MLTVKLQLKLNSCAIKYLHLIIVTVVRAFVLYAKVSVDVNSMPVNHVIFNWVKAKSTK